MGFLVLLEAVLSIFHSWTHGTAHSNLNRNHYLQHLSIVAAFLESLNFSFDQ